MTDWRHFAACVDEDPELFHPEGDGPATQVQIAEAKAVCRRCLVRQECLTWAMTELRYGIAGGLTAHERSLARRNAARKSRAVPAIAGAAGAPPDRPDVAA